MLRHQREIEAENHIKTASGHRCDLGDVPSLETNTPVEDSLIQCLEDTLMDQRIAYFREWLKAKGALIGTEPLLMERVQGDEGWAWLTVLTLTCEFRRMGHRWQYAANRLRFEYGLQPNQFGDGTRSLGF